MGDAFPKQAIAWKQQHLDQNCSAFSIGAWVLHNRILSFSIKKQSHKIRETKSLLCVSQKKIPTLVLMLQNLHT